MTASKTGSGAVATGTSSGRAVVGVDVGGTFTDIFVYRSPHGVGEAGSAPAGGDETVRIAKVPSTPADPSRGFVEGVLQAVDDIKDIGTILHGTTVATNALLEEKGAKTGIITTTGFADVLEMRRRDRPTTWGLRGHFEPVIPRNLRLEVDERVLADGTVRTPINLVQVEAQAKKLLSMGCESVCLFFINGYANDANEKAAASVIRDCWPNDYVSVATEIIPEIREFERLSTTALNAYLQPLVAGYLDQLEKTLQQKGFNGNLLIVQSNGGVMSVESARKLPVRTALSGPAAGVIAAQSLAAAAGMDNIVTCDMGGTSFDVSLVANGNSSLAAQTSIGFGKVIRTPMIEITTIGAGGGSIASVDADGLLKVGPESAGSDPGPVCYGHGSTRPTVTDANLVLGRINAERPIGGVLARLDTDAAAAAIDEHVGKPLGLPAMAAAEAILRVANAHMAGAIRLVSIERGHDPGRFAAMPFGGGGALHTGALMKDVGLQAALVPRYPGITSALGCVVADMRHDRVHTVNQMLDDADTEKLAREMDVVAAELQRTITESGIAFDRLEHQFELDMLYLGQTHAVSVALDREPGSKISREQIEQAFDVAYENAFGRLLEAIPRRLHNYRVIVIGRRPVFDMKILGDTREAQMPEPVSHRKAWIDGADQSVPVYDREQFFNGCRVTGPVILEQSDTTIYVDPGLQGHTDAMGNLLITRLEV